MRGLELGADDYLVKPFAFSELLAPAVAASASVPILYQPVEIDGRLLVDGALTAPVPVDAARELGADVVIAVDVAYRPYEDTVSGITGVAFQMFPHHGQPADQ